MSPDRAEIAWAAGIFEGEGCIHIGSTAVALIINMTDKDVLDRFAAAVGVGRVRGPIAGTRENGGAGMTWQQRLEAAKTEVARRKVIALAATPGPWCEYGGELWTGDAADLAAYDADPDHAYFDNRQLFCGDVEETADAAHIAVWNPAHVLQVLDIHRLVLALADPWLVGRLDQPGPITDPVRALLDLYAPVTADADAAS